MPRRISSSQLRSQIRQSQTKQRQAIQRYNNKVRQINTERRNAVNSYNRAVRAYNSRVRANRNRLQGAIRRLSQQPATDRYRATYHSSLELSDSYQHLDAANADPFLSDLAEREAANSASLVNVLLGESGQSSEFVGALADSGVAALLSDYPEDLQNRWAGAIFSLNPENPDAARHFCSSTREIITAILNITAPDAAVLEANPNCRTTNQGTPARSAKIQYCLARSGLTESHLESFVEANIKDLNVLFNDLNSGTHGAAGKFSLPQLLGIKKRAEDAIDFICQIVS